MSKIYIYSFILFLVVACSGQWNTYPERTDAVNKAVPTIEIGDTLNVSVFDESNLSGDYPVLADGTIQIPLIGTIEVAGLDIPQAAELISKKFIEKGYLTDPKLTLSMAQSNTVKIMGEVRGAGEYPFTEGMTILGLVAKAGGFSYRANQNKFDIVRKQSNNMTEKVIGGALSTRLMPGDIVRVKERFF